MPESADWSFFLKRRRKTLEGFLSKCKNMQEARQKFIDLELSPPSDEALTKVFDDRKAAAAKNFEEKNKPKKTTPRKSSAKKTSPKASKKPDQTKTSKEEAKTDGKYFRKVFPSKKK